MKKYFIGWVLMAFLVSFAARSEEGEIAADGHEEVLSFIKDRFRSSKGNITKGLESVTLDEWKRRKQTVQLIFTKKPPPLTMDGLSYFIYVNSSAQRYWVKVTGGIAGAVRVYGPGTIQLHEPKDHDRSVD